MFFRGSDGSVHMVRLANIQNGSDIYQYMNAHLFLADFWLGVTALNFAGSTVS